MCKDDCVTFKGIGFSDQGVRILCFYPYKMDTLQSRLPVYQAGSEIWLWETAQGKLQWARAGDQDWNLAS